MKYEKCKAVYTCCGKYYAPTDSASEKQIVCQTCGKKLLFPVKTPHIVIVKIK